MATDSVTAPSHPARSRKSRSGRRSEVVIAGEVAFYHCWARCVRQSWLCGYDTYSHKNYQHRRAWIESFAQELARLVGLDVGWFAVLANHMHFILRARPDLVKTWSDQEVARRYLTIQRLIKSSDGHSIEAPSEAEIFLACKEASEIAEWRERLAHPSMFMGSLCENIARRANKDDGCKGRFFDQRYGCRRLETTAAVLACALYVDLNVLAAAEADAPENSRHTSAYRRIAARQRRKQLEKGEASSGAGGSTDPDAWLSPLELDQRTDAFRLVDSGSTTGLRASDRGLIPMSLDAYLELLDWAGRAARQDKPGRIPEHLGPILDRLHLQRLDAEATRKGRPTPLAMVRQFNDVFGKVVGTAKKVAECAKTAGRRWYRGAKACQVVFG